MALRKFFKVLGRVGTGYGFEVEFVSSAVEIDAVSEMSKKFEDTIRSDFRKLADFGFSFGNIRIASRTLAGDTTNSSGNILFCYDIFCNKLEPYDIFDIEDAISSLRLSGI